MRVRSIIHVLSMELFGRSVALPDFPVRPDISGIGISDWEGYAGLLSQKLGYKNSYFHKKPYLDITAIDRALVGTADFVISSEVFEHVPPPVSVAFENARRLLKPDGVLILTTPYVMEGTTEEHFPELYKFDLVKDGNRSLLKNRTEDGREQVFENLIFHGGHGFTLEMRYFSKPSLEGELKKAGFSRIVFYDKPEFKHGIYYKEEFSLPIAARIK